MREYDLDSIRQHRQNSKSSGGPKVICFKLSL